MVSMKARFEEPGALLEALRAQRLIQGDVQIAEEIAQHGELVEFAPGELLIEQGATDRCMYFLLSGKVQVIVNRMRLYPREPGVTVGEMSAIHSQIPRSATIEAEQPTVALRILHTQLDAIGERHPHLWRRIAIELASRLEQRNKLISRANLRPRVFIISSSEALDTAKAIRIGLEHEKAIVVLWSDDQIFPAGSYPLEDLEREVNEADFGIAIAQPDDLIRSRDRQSMTPRDNVIFELGFFMSRLGRARTLLLVPKGEDVKLPSDFKGVMPMYYKAEEPGIEISVTLGATIDRISTIIRKQGVKASLVQAK